MKVFFKFIFLLLVFNSCSKPGIDEEITTIPIDLELSKDALYSEKFDSISYILLDVPEEVPLVRPFKIQIKNDKIYLEDRDRNSLVVFGNDGNFIDIISSPGEANGEIRSMEDFQVTNNNIFILDGSLRKVLVFDLQYNFIEEIKIDYHSYNFFKNDSFSLFYYANESPDERGFSIHRKEGGGNIGYMKINEGLKGINYSSINGFMFDDHRDNILFKFDTSYDIAVFNSEGYLNEQIKFNFGRYSFPLDMRIIFSLSPQKYDYLMENNMVENISSFFPFKNQYFMMVSQQGVAPTYLFLNNDFEVIFQSNNFENDIDGMDIRILPWTYTEDRIVFQISSSNFYNEYNRSFPGKIPQSDQNKGVHLFFNKNKDKLLEDKYVIITLKVK